MSAKLHILGTIWVVYDFYLHFAASYVGSYDAAMLSSSLCFFSPTTLTGSFVSLGRLLWLGLVSLDGLCCEDLFELDLILHNASFLWMISLRILLLFTSIHLISVHGFEGTLANECWSIQSLNWFVMNLLIFFLVWCLFIIRICIQRPLYSHGLLWYLVINPIFYLYLFRPMIRLLKMAIVNPELMSIQQIVIDVKLWHLRTGFYLIEIVWLMWDKYLLAWAFGRLSFRQRATFVSMCDC